MNTTYSDNILGELVYKRAWIGSTSAFWNGKNVPIKIKVKAANGQMPSDFQRLSYQKFTGASSLQQCKQKLLVYCKKVYDPTLDEATFEKNTTPVTVILAQNIFWGILFRCKWESELLLAVKFTETSVEAGVDDILL